MFTQFSLHVGVSEYTYMSSDDWWLTLVHPVTVVYKSQPPEQVKIQDTQMNVVVHVTHCGWQLYEMVRECSSKCHWLLLHDWGRQLETKVHVSYVRFASTNIHLLQAQATQHHLAHAEIGWHGVSRVNTFLPFFSTIHPGTGKGFLKATRNWMLLCHNGRIRHKWCHQGQQWRHLPLLWHAPCLSC